MNTWQLILSSFLPVVFGILAPILAYFVYSLLKKWGINVNIATLDELAGKGAAYAEEQANKALKAGEPLTSGAEKMKIAVDFVIALLAQYGLPAMAVTEIEKLIEAWLSVNRVVEPVVTIPVINP